MRKARAMLARLAGGVDLRDFVGVVGAVLMWHGGETLMPGVGSLSVGVVLLLGALVIR